MKNPTIEINGVTYTLATTLRVAYKIQGMNDHKSYTEVFKDLAIMPVENQIDIVFASFSCANKDTTFTVESFREYCMDNFTVADLMTVLGEIVNGIVGKDEDTDDTDKNAKN